MEEHFVLIPPVTFPFLKDERILVFVVKLV